MSFSEDTSIEGRLVCDSISTSGCDDDYEEALIFVKFEDFTDANFFIESEEININNIEGSAPQCFIDGFRFAGTHNLNLGTLLFLEEKSLPNDLVEVEFTGTTDTILEFSLRSIPTVESKSTSNFLND